MKEKRFSLFWKPYMQTVVTYVTVLFAHEIKARKEMKRLMDCSVLELWAEKGEGRNQFL